MPRARVVLLVCIVALAACSTSSPSSDPNTTATSSPPGATFAGQLASTDLYVDAPQHVQFGIVSQDPAQGVLLLTSGTLDAALSPPAGSGGTPVQGTADYVAAPGTEVAEGAPRLTAPDVGRGVYQVDATFDVAGEWTAILTGETDHGTVTVPVTVPVAEDPELPAPGQPAIRSRNLTADAPNAEAVDSRAMDGAPIPDPELHADTIRDALADGRPVLALFATPVYCESRFCGPTTDAMQALAADGPPGVAYLHVEIWHDFAASEVNAAAAEWLLRDGALSEPWLYLIGADGIVVDRWSPLFDPDDVRGALASV